MASISAEDLFTILADLGRRIDEIATLVNNQRERVDSVIGVQETTTRHLDTISEQIRDTNDNVTAMATTLRTASYGSSSTTSGTRTDKNYVAKPTPFNGDGDLSESRFFLATFANWAKSMGPTLNNMNASGSMVRDDQKWISAVLNFLTDKARSWALPALEKIADGKQAYSNWAEFDEAFRKRFEPVNVKKAAQEAIKALKQGKLSVEQYKARFDEQSPRTGYPDDVLAEHYYKGLTERTKDVMMGIGFNREEMDSVHRAAQEAGERIRQRDGEQKHTESSLDKGKSTHTRDPDAMDIDASRLSGNNGSPLFNANQPGPNGKTITDWRNSVVNKCNRCGSKEHVAKNGNHERDICNHCQKAGHRSTACMRKFMGYPATQKIRSADVGATPPSGSGAGQAQGVAATTAGDKDKAKMKELEDKIALLMKEQEAIKSAF